MSPSLDRKEGKSGDGQGFCQAISNLGTRRDGKKIYETNFEFVFDDVVIDFNVLGVFVKSRIVCQLDNSAIVTIQRSWSGKSDVEV